MSSIKNFIFVLTLIFSVPDIKCEENEDLFVIFTQQLSVTECHRNVNQETPICQQKSPWLISEFLHRLPNESSFACLNSAEALDPTTISASTLNELEKKWVRIDWSPDPSIAVEKLWYRFGGCTSKINEISNAANYFKKSLELHEKYNLNSILSEANITSGNHYTAQQISDAVSSATGGKKVLLICPPKFGTDQITLEMITIYLDKSFKPIDAVNYEVDTRDVCPPDKPILYEEKKVILDNSGEKVIDYVRRVPTFKSPQSPEKLYGDPAVKYPTLMEDDNGYYIFEQRLDDFDCFKDDVSQCALPKYPWYINSFTYEFNQDIRFDCESHHDNFDPKNISSIQDELSEKWNNKMDDVVEAFGYRWAYRARCSAYFKGLDSPFKFYKKSIELFDKYNMNVILRESNITPGNNYTFQAIADAVSKGLQGAKADIACSSGFSQKIYDLTSIIIYFDQSFNPINETGDSYYKNLECPLDRMIRYKDFKLVIGKNSFPVFDYAPIA